MSRPRYHIDTRWSDKHREMRWCAIDGDTGIPVGNPKDFSFYKAEDAMTFCSYLNLDDAKAVKGKDGYNGNIKGLDF